MTWTATMSRRATSTAGRVVAAVAWAFGAASALAQVPSSIVIDPSESPMRCLVVPTSTMSYPEGAATRKEGGTVRVKLTFAAPDQAPRIDVFFDTVGHEFRESVIDRVERYRLPCLTPGSDPVVATQEFAFLPGDARKVVSSPARGNDPRQGRIWRCITGLERPPDYPASGLRMRAEPWQGTVIARLEFFAADQPPRVELLSDGGDPRFARVVRGFVEGYRVPCLTPADLPVKATQPFMFRMAGAPIQVLKDASLVSFLRGLDHLESQHVRFDFTTMGCPFDVRFVVWRPYMDNAVGELDRSDPNRREFIEWLRHVDLKIPSDMRPKIAGEEMTISVPCTVLDLL